MKCYSYRRVRVWALVLGPLLLETTQHAATGKEHLLQPAEVCADFAPAGGNPQPAWTLDECIQVWTQFSDTLPAGLHRRMPHVDIWRETATELRRAGSPCLAASKPSGDGAGSSTIRHLASWIFAEEMGCDWVTPDWGKRHVGAENGTVMYCHRTATLEERDHPEQVNTLQELHHCSVVDWLAYFQFDVPSVSLPESRADEVIQVPVCLAAKIPDDCLMKQAGFKCSPDRSGVFYVVGKPIVLHVGADVQNALSCMIQADGLLMGCSTFGQVAGVLSKGLSFFSMHCSGGRTPTQYKTIPPLAIAERGHLWVPVTGSWRDPVLTSTDVLTSALDTLISDRNAALSLP